jgi:hypothetical protein
MLLHDHPVVPEDRLLPVGISCGQSFARLAVERRKWPLEEFSLSGIVGVDRVIS